MRFNRFSWDFQYLGVRLEHLQHNVVSVNQD